MWINPKLKDQVEPPDRPAPPTENGRRLATFTRGAASEMRVNLSEFQGKPYINLRLWKRGKTGLWWPVNGKGCSIRIGEAGELAEALAGVASGGRRDEFGGG